MVDCFDCGKNISWKEAKRSKQDMKLIGDQAGFEDEVEKRMDEKDRLCIPCVEALHARHALKVYNYFKSNMNESQWENYKKDWPTVVEKAEQKPKGVLPSGFSTTESPTSEATVSTNSALPKSTSNTTSSNQSNMATISADQLRALTSSRHDEFKAQWDKNGLVQFKNDKIVILKRMVGQQVQFIVAYDKITEEGYRLMAIDEGMTAQGSGFSGGASAYFYFQKMDYVR